MTNKNTKKIEEALEKYKSENFFESENLIKELLSVEKKNSEAYKLLAMIYLKTDKKKDAWIHAKKAFDLDMSNIDNWMIFISALIQAEKFDDAGIMIKLAKEKKISQKKIEFLEDALSANFSNLAGDSITHIDTFSSTEEIHDNNTKYIKNIKNNNPMAFELNELIDLMKFNKFEELIKASNKFIKNYPNDFSGYQYIGYAYFSIMDYQNAYENFHKSYELNKDMHLLGLNIVNCYLKLKKNKKAKELLQNILIKDPDIQLNESQKALID